MTVASVPVMGRLAPGTDTAGVARGGHTPKASDRAHNPAQYRWSLFILNPSTPPTRCVPNIRPKLTVPDRTSPIHFIVVSVFYQVEMEMGSRSVIFLLGSRDRRAD